MEKIVFFLFYQNLMENEPIFLPELLQEVVMLDDGSTREYITNGTIDRYIERWNGKVKV